MYYSEDITVDATRESDRVVEKRNKRRMTLSKKKKTQKERRERYWPASVEELCLMTYNPLRY